MKCLFDNNLSPKLAKTLDYLEGNEGVSVEHIKDKFSPATPDVEWITKLAQEGNWFVITQDSQIKKRPHERKAWQESNIPIVFLQKTWINHDFWEISWRLIRHWPKLKESINRNKKAKSFELSVNGKITVIE